MRLTSSILALVAACSYGRMEAPSRVASAEQSRGYPPPAPAPEPVAGSAARDEGGRDGDVDSKKSDDAQNTPKTGEARPSEAPKPQRMLHYNGYAKLRVDAIRKSEDEASAIALAAGGFIEQLGASSITLRVPVAKFKEVFNALLKLGQVEDKSITAHDVTEAFTAIELRLQTAKLSRDRLIALLAKARSEREKLDLLREIQRLSLEIEEMDSAQKTIASLASMSRITLALDVRRQNTESAVDEPIAAFRWIHGLSPFRRDVAFEGKRLGYEVPKGFVALDDRQHFVSESADGAVFWASKRDNVPQGSTRFWADALKTRLGPEFSKVDEKAIGDAVLLRFVDRGDTPYTYLVSVRADDNELHLAEAYFPSADHETRYGEAVTQALTKGKQ